MPSGQRWGTEDNNNIWQRASSCVRRGGGSLCRRRVVQAPKILFRPMAWIDLFEPRTELERKQRRSKPAAHKQAPPHTPKAKAKKCRRLSFLFSCALFFWVGFGRTAAAQRVQSPLSPTHAQSKVKLSGGSHPLLLLHFTKSKDTDTGSSPPFWLLNRIGAALVPGCLPVPAPSRFFFLC
jgi:hypothetical protein